MIHCILKWSPTLILRQHLTVDDNDDDENDDDENDENDDEPADISGPTRPTRPGMEYAVRGDSTPLTLTNFSAPGFVRISN